MAMVFLKHAIRLARPGHWIKNIIVLFPVVFAQRMGDPHAWSSAALAAVAFCLASSASYIFNDIFDRDKDRLHPRKSGRPLAAGQIGLSAAAAEALMTVNSNASFAAKSAGSAAPSSCWNSTGRW